jgi:hypothetical protein
VGSIISGLTLPRKATVLENCALLGYFAANCGNPLPTYRNNLLVPSSRVRDPPPQKKKPVPRWALFSSNWRRKLEITHRCSLVFGIVRGLDAFTRFGLGITLLITHAFIKSQGLKWLGHVERMPNEREVTRIYKWKPLASRPKGRPKNSWEDDVRMDLQKMKIKNWKRSVLDRN